MKKRKPKITLGQLANRNRSLNSKEAKMPTQYEYNPKRSQIQFFSKMPFYILAADSIVIIMCSFLLCLLLSFSREIQVYKKVTYKFGENKLMFFIHSSHHVSNSELARQQISKLIMLYIYTVHVS